MQTNGPWRVKTCLRRFANNKGADQTVHHRCLISAFVISLLESIISKLATSEFHCSKVVSVAEQTGLSLTLSETPNTGFVASRPKLWSLKKLNGPSKPYYIKLERGTIPSVYRRVKAPFCLISGTEFQFFLVHQIRVYAGFTNVRKLYSENPVPTCGKIKIKHPHAGRQVTSLSCYSDAIMLFHVSAY